MNYGALIRQLQGALNGNSLRTGSVTLTWSASTSSGNQVVAHGLKTTPNVFFGARSTPFAGGVVIEPKCVSRDATNITINAESNTSVTGSVTVDWLAVG